MDKNTKAIVEAIKETKEITKAIKDLTSELHWIRLLMISWDEIPPVDEADQDKYIL